MDTQRVGRSKAAKAKKQMRVRCNQCEAVIINGLYCHETGCPNAKARYDMESDTWIKQRKCLECGSTVDADDLCCNGEQEAI